ncbi:MAG: hypothetical protein DRH37_09205, partial [Deltaproteobacteria bacterium]
MATNKLIKEKIVVADMIFGMGTITDSRGTQQAINGNFIPFSDTQSINQALLDRDTKADMALILAYYAAINGNNQEPFAVGSAGTNDDAMPRRDVNTAIIDAMANVVENKDVLLVNGQSPLLIPTLDTQPANKKYVDDTLIAIGAGDMVKAVYDKTNSGTVDSAEALGKATDFMGKTPADEVMRFSQFAVADCNTLPTFGLFAGIDVVNAPVNGPILLEQLLAIDAGKLQRITINDGTMYTRAYDAGTTFWSQWVQLGAKGDMGPAGLAATLDVGTTTTSASGGDAEVSNSGTVNNAIFDFIIPRGQQGEVWYLVAGVPQDGTGVDGDLAMNTLTSDYYEKSGGTWAIQGNLQGTQGPIGPQGPDGPQGIPGMGIYPQGTATVAELNALVSDPGAGDLWVMLDAGTVTYGSQPVDVLADDWLGWGADGYFVNLGAIEGPAGADGAVWYNGADNPLDTLGVDGDYYLNNTSSDYFTKASGTWGTTIGNLKGIQGTTGTAGTDGTDGAVWYHGSAVPEDTLGIDGDYYLNDTTSDYYAKSGG